MCQARHYGTNFHELSLLILQKSHNFINCILQMRKLRAGDTQYLVLSETTKAELGSLNSNPGSLNHPMFFFFFFFFNHPMFLTIQRLYSLSFRSSTWCSKKLFQLHLLLLAKNFTQYCHTFHAFFKLHAFLLLFSLLENIFSFSAKSLQSCPTLYNPIDGSPPGSPVPGILQARTLK